MNRLLFAQRYLSKKWQPIPIPNSTNGQPQKGPLYKGWEQLIVTEADLSHHFEGEGNIGLLLGVPSQNLVDVDIDSPEALALAHEFLPPTGMISGRTGKPKSHFWYLVEGIPRTQKFAYRGADKGQHMLVELRGTGGQTVVPPSRHPAGGVYFWDQEDDPGTVAYKVLVNRVQALALASLLARFWPGPGARHDAALPIAGVFAHAGWPEHDAARIVFLAAKVAGHANPNDREHVIRSTYRKKANGQDVQGARALRSFMEEGVVDTFVKWVKGLAPEATLTPVPKTEPRTAPSWLPVLRTFSDIEERRVPWLWSPYIPLGRITMLEGDPGQGKSWFSLAIATCVSLGRWMDVGAGENLTAPSHVLYVTCEDDPEDTIKKRLRILQANQDHIHYLDGKKKQGSDTTINVTLADLPLLSSAIDHTHAKLVVIDPVQAYLPNGVDMSKAEQVRPMLRALQRLALEKQCAVILLRHLAKGSKDRALYKGMGSIDFTAAARSVLVCAERPELAEKTGTHFRRRFAVAQVKNNIAPQGQTLEFELQPDLFFWLGTIDLSAEQLLTPESGATQQIQEAKTFLLNTLHSGSLEAQEILKKSRHAGIENKILMEAKAQLSIEARQDVSGWTWFLPGKYLAH